MGETERVGARCDHFFEGDHVKVVGHPGRAGTFDRCEDLVGCFGTVKGTWLSNNYRHIVMVEIDNPPPLFQRRWDTTKSWWQCESLHLIIEEEIRQEFLKLLEMEALDG